MAWQDKMLAIKGNFLQPDATGVNDATVDATSSAFLNDASRWENTMNYYASRPLRFSGISQSSKFVRFVFPATRLCDCAAVINVHTNQINAQTNRPPVEARYQVRINAGPITDPTLVMVQDWVSLDLTNAELWGHNMFFHFAASTAQQTWTFFFRAASELEVPLNITSLSVGNILLGQLYQFPGNPLIEHPRHITAVATVIGRPFGSAQFWQREEAVERLSLDNFHADEISRVGLTRLIGGRGRRRFTGSEFARFRLDIPSALITPDMWESGSSTYGGCVFGRFTGVESGMRVGGQALTSAQFEEVA